VTRPPFTQVSDHDFPKNSQEVVAFAISGDAFYVASVPAEGEGWPTVHVHRGGTLERIPLETEPGWPPVVNCASFATEGALVVEFGDAYVYAVHSWDLESGAMGVARTTSAPETAAGSDSAEVAIVEDLSHRIVVLSAVTGSPTEELVVPPSFNCPVLALCRSWVGIAKDTGEIAIVARGPSGDVAYLPRTWSKCAVEGLAASPDGRYLAISPKGLGMIHLWNVHTKQRLEVHLESSLYTDWLGFSHDSAWLAAATSTELTIFHSATGFRATWPSGGPFAVSADGAWIVVRTDKGWRWLETKPRSGLH